jgi:hypothetical protein
MVIVEAPTQIPSAFMENLTKRDLAEVRDGPVYASIRVK